MKTSQEDGNFYEAMWFSDDDSDEPIVRGPNVDDIINALLGITENRDGHIEVYQITYNDLGFKIQLCKKFEVLNKLKLTEI